MKCPAAPFEPLLYHGDSITLDISGKVLVLPTGDPTKLPLYNEYALTEGRALSSGTITFTNDADTNTGLQNLISPWIACYDPANSEIDFFLFTYAPKGLQCTIDESGTITTLVLYPGNGQVYHGRITHCNPSAVSRNLWTAIPGTLYTNTPSVLLTDIDGNNPSQTLTPTVLGNRLSINSESHTITEEFIIKNESVSNDPVVIDTLSSTTGWSINSGSGVLSIENGKLKFVGTTSITGTVDIAKTLNSSYVASKNVLSYSITSSISTVHNIELWSTDYTKNRRWTDSRFSIDASTETFYTIPYKAFYGTGGYSPNIANGTIPNEFILALTFTSAPETAITLYISPISLDSGKPSYIELYTPDILSEAPYTFSLQCWTGAAYETVRTDKLNSTFENVSLDSSKLTLLGGTKLDDVYGSGLGCLIFPKNSANAIVTGSDTVTTHTYSNILPSQKRIGIMVSLPPSDGRTNFSKIRLKTVIDYDPLTTLPSCLNKWDDGSVTKFLNSYGMRAI
jgi:hypothetical protein